MLSHGGFHDRSSDVRGFTLSELMIVMILTGILAVVALPKLGAIFGLRADNWRDQVSAALRYAQKTAIAHRRVVCATVGATSVSLSVAPVKGAATCTKDLLGPGGSNVFAQSGAASVTVSVSPAGTLYFQPDGRVTTDAAGTASATYAFTFPGASALTLYGETGYAQ